VRASSVSRSCPDENALTAFAKGTLSEPERATIEEHCEECDACRLALSFFAQAFVSATKATTEGQAAAAVSDGALQRGSVLGRYLVLERIGSGAMGEVFAVYDPDLDRRVAIKVLRSDCSNPRMHEWRARFVREARTVAAISHPNIIVVYDVGTHGDDAYFAMELIPGGTLSQWLARAPRTVREILGVLEAAGRGLAAAHRHGLVHRDFKPDNILVADDGRVRVSDFGLVRFVDRHETNPTDESTTGAPAVDIRTQTRALVGTPAYMAPEQLQGEPADARSDQFSFCVTVHEAVFGERPFSGGTLAALTEDIERGRIRWPSAPTGRDGLPRRSLARLRSVLTRGLSADPRARFSDMDALLLALARVPRSRPIFALGAAVTGGAAISAVAFLDRPTGPGCEDTAAELADIWTETQRTKMREVFSASDAPYASDVLQTAERKLDEYTHSWRTARVAVCEQQIALSKSEEGAYLLQRLCLEERRIGLSFAIDLLTEPDTAPIEKAVDVVLQLQPVIKCAELGRNVSAADLPAGEDLEKLRQAKALLAQAHVLRSAGRYEEGLETVERAADIADASGDRTTAAIAYLKVADLREPLGLGGVDEALDTSLLRSIEGKDFEMVAQTTMTMGTVAAYRGEPSSARQWLTRARAALVAAGENDELLARFENARTIVAQAAGDVDEMLEASRGALAATERAQARGGTPLVLAAVHNGVANALVRRGDLEEAAEHAERALAIVHEHLGSRHPRAAAFAVVQGMILGERGRFDDAREVLEPAMRLARETLSPDHRTTLELAGILAGVYMDTHDYQAAADLHRYILDSRQASADGSPLEAEFTRLNLGAAVWKLGDLGEARVLLQDAREQVTALLGAEHPVSAFATVMFANVCIDQGAGASILEDLEEAVRILERQRLSPSDLPKAHFTLARALWQVGDDRQRAVGLARSARSDLTALPGTAADVSEVDDWLENIDAD
jgi:eukaryotic-like serine/threonine-protein kinase